MLPNIRSGLPSSSQSHSSIKHFTCWSEKSYHCFPLGTQSKPHRCFSNSYLNDVCTLHNKHISLLMLENYKTFTKLTVTLGKTQELNYVTSRKEITFCVASEPRSHYKTSQQGRRKHLSVFPLPPPNTHTSFLQLPRNACSRPWRDNQTLGPTLPFALCGKHLLRWSPPPTHSSSWQIGLL